MCIRSRVNCFINNYNFNLKTLIFFTCSQAQKLHAKLILLTLLLAIQNLETLLTLLNYSYITIFTTDNSTWTPDPNIYSITIANFTNSITNTTNATVSFTVSTIINSKITITTVKT